MLLLQHISKTICFLKHKYLLSTCNVENMRNIFVITFISIACNFGYAQKYLIDSSFGNSGSFEFKPALNKDFGGIQIDEENNIFLFGANLLFYLDSNGIKTTIGKRSNPDTFKLNSNDLLSGSLQKVSPKDLNLTSYSSVAAGLNINIKQIDIENIDNSTFENNTSIEIEKNVDFGIGFGQVKNKYVLALSNYESIDNRKNIKLVRVDNFGKIDSAIFYTKESCHDGDCSIGFTNVIDDSTGNLFFGYNYLKSDSEYVINLIKLKSNYSIDSGFGNQGFLRIHEGKYVNSVNLFLHSIVCNKFNDIFLLFGQNSELKIKKIKSNGTFDNSFGNNGEINLQQIDPYSIIFYYDKDINEIIFFVYDIKNQYSKLFGIRSDGQFNNEIEANGGLIVQGKVIDFKPLGMQHLLVLEKSDIPFDRAMKLSSFKLNSVTSTNESKVYNSIQAFPNPFRDHSVLKFPDKFENQWKNISFFSFDGKLIKTCSTLRNEIILSRDEIPFDKVIILVISETGLRKSILVTTMD